MTREMQKYITINETNYMIQVLPPTRAIKLLTRLTKIVGEPMAQMAAASSKSNADMIPKAVSALLQRLDENNTISIINEMMTCVTVDNKPITFERQFHGKLGELMKVCKEVIEVNYSDFLQEISDLMN